MRPQDGDPAPQIAAATSRSDVFRLAWPIVVANSAVPLLGLVDTAVIGNTGTVIGKSNRPLFRHLIHLDNYIALTATCDRTDGIDTGFRSVGGIDNVPDTAGIIGRRFCIRHGAYCGETSCSS